MGEATSAYAQGMPFDQLLAKGRWKHLATACLYLDQALQEYTALILPPRSCQKIRLEEGARRA